MAVQPRRFAARRGAMMRQRGKKRRKSLSKTSHLHNPTQRPFSDAPGRVELNLMFLNDTTGEFFEETMSADVV
jgi:hypothetical protein